MRRRAVSDLPRSGRPGDFVRDSREIGGRAAAMKQIAFSTIRVARLDETGDFARALINPAICLQVSTPASWVLTDSYKLLSIHAFRYVHLKA